MFIHQTNHRFEIQVNFGDNFDKKETKESIELWGNVHHGNFCQASSIIQSEFAGISSSDPKLDVHPGQILGAHDVSLEFGLAVGEEVEDSVLLNRESSLDNRHCCCCCIQGRACLHFSVDLEEVSKLDNASGGSTCILHHGLVVDYAGLVERVVHYAGVSVAAQGVVAGGVSVHPIVIQILGGGQGRGEQAEEDQHAACLSVRKRLPM